MRHTRLFQKLGFALLLSALLLLDDHGNLKAEDLVGNGDLTVSGGSWGKVYGMQRQPKSGDAQAEAARLSISGGSVSGNVYGGYARSDDGAARAAANNVTITGMQGNPASIYGGYAYSASNTVATANRLFISGSPAITSSSAYGGRADASGGSGGLYLATNNHVTIDITSSLYQVFGGSISAVNNATANVGSYGNEVIIRRGTIEEVYGGRASGNGMVDVSGNRISISGGAVTQIVGGNAYSTHQNAIADDNTILITGGTHGNIIAASVQSNTMRSSASNNAVYLSNTTVGGVTGGYSTSTGTAVSLNYNSIVVGAGAVVTGNVHGGDARGTASGNSATHNTISVVQGGQVQGDLTGGDLSGAGNASYNTILINNGSAGGDIIGGRTAAGGSAAGNSIILGRQARIAPTSNLFGGVVGGQAVSSRGSGNTLFVDSWQGTVARAAGFENLHFVLPAPGTPAAGVPMLTVTSARQDDFKGTTVTAQLPDSITGGNVHIGETFVLVKDSSKAINKADIGGLVGLLHGYATIYDGVIFDENDAIVLRVGGARGNPLAGALTEARIGAAGLLNQGGDLIAGSALRAADTAARETRGWAAFATLYGGAASLTAETDVTTRGLSLVTGLARHTETAWADVLAGAFFETGYGNLVTAREAAGEIVKGYGHTRYTGGGLLARLDITRGLLRGLYLEASARAGEIITSWSSDDLLDNMDRPAEYDLTTPYYGGHAGLGCLLPLSETWTLDLYGKYLFAHQEGQDTAINGDAFHFDAVDSGRLRCGTRLSGAVSPSGSVYLGAAWEQEMYATARAASRSSHMSVPSTAMTGSSALVELGFTVTPEHSPLRLDMALEGSAGTRRSIGGHVHMVYEF